MREHELEFCRARDPMDMGIIPVRQDICVKGPFLKVLFHVMPEDGLDSAIVPLHLSVCW